MSTRVDDLTTALHGILDMLPGTSGVSFHVHAPWSYILITAAADAAVYVLGEDLELGAVTVRSIPDQLGKPDQWWRRAMLERRELRVEVYGPHHVGAPPDADGGPEQ